ncbi:MAG: hypothetical protein EAY69_06855 [Cytophagales bacterium]|nr:MAG: hypothetical protein EAY69_06855 [Cytophagales bacterium]
MFFFFLQICIFNRSSIVYLLTIKIIFLMKTLESVKNDVFASFADAQMSKEEMKMVRGGKNVATGSGFITSKTIFCLIYQYASDTDHYSETSGDLIGTSYYDSDGGFIKAI